MSLRTFLAFLTSLALAGCLDTPPVDDGRVDDALASVTLTLQEALNIGPGADAESSIVVSDDGQVILVCSHGGFTQPSPLWASTDAGATFARIEPQPNQPFNGDCDVSIAPDGAWAIVYDTVYSATVAVSTDQGENWNVNPITAYAVVGGVDRPWIHAVTADRLYMTYKSVGGGQPELDIFAVSTDGGVTWIQGPYFVPSPPDRNGAIPGDMWVSEDGQTVRVPFIVSPSDDGDQTIENAVSRDGGATWQMETLGTVLSANGIPAGDRGADGTVYFSYGAGTGEGDVGDVMLAYSRDEGATWSEPLVVAPQQNFGGLLGGEVWVAAGPDGKATLFWVTKSGEGEATIWQHAAARVDVNDPKNPGLVTAVGPASPPHDSDLYEFAEVDTDATGRAYFAFPAKLNADCKQTPAFPSQVGSQNIPRNTACQFVVIEDVAAPASDPA